MTRGSTNSLGRPKRLTKINKRKRLFAGTVPVNKNLFAGTVPANKSLFAGTQKLKKASKNKTTLNIKTIIEIESV